MHRIKHSEKHDHKFTSIVLCLFQQNCCYISNTTEQMLKLHSGTLAWTIAFSITLASTLKKKKNMSIIVLLHSSETLPMQKKR